MCSFLLQWDLDFGSIPLKGDIGCGLKRLISLETLLPSRLIDGRHPGSFSKVFRLSFRKTCRARWLNRLRERREFGFCYYLTLPAFQSLSGV
jgi:hypothetical protein